MVKKYRFKFTDLAKTVIWAQMLLVRVEIKRIVLAMFGKKLTNRGSIPPQSTVLTVENSPAFCNRCELYNGRICISTLHGKLFFEIARHPWITELSQRNEIVPSVTCARQQGDWSNLYGLTSTCEAKRKRRLEHILVECRVDSYLVEK